MKGTRQTEPYIKFVFYAVVVVLINIVGISLFFRADLTHNHVYTLSEASKQAVAGLSGPLTIDLFFTENLPAPYNGTRRYLNDLLEEYSIYAKRPYFNYRFYNVSSMEEGGGKEAENNRKLAESYGIRPIQIQVLEQDEVKFKQAYMGLVIIYGNLVEKISPVTSTNGLEYKLTTMIQKLNRKTNRLLNLHGKIKVRLVMSSSLKDVSSLIGLKDLPGLPERIKQIVAKINRKNYNKFQYEYVDPDPSEIPKLRKKYRVMMLKWPELASKGVSAGNGLIGVIVSYKNESRTINILNAYSIPLFGTQYKLADLSSVSDLIDGVADTLIGINMDLGYMADHGAMPLYEGMNNIRTLLSQNYTLKNVQVSDKGIPVGLNCLIIAHPTEKFSDYDLYQIDQALMRGTNIAIFTDAFREISPNNRRQAFMGSQYVPLDTGLEKLLDYYGVHVNRSYVMDKNCYKQTLPSSRGGGERPVYFAPIIKNKNINHELPFMHNIKGLITMKNSPVIVDKKTVEKNGLKYYTLFSSSDESWEMKGMINLNPMFIRPPESRDKFGKRPLACLIEGEFPSYFKGKPIPEKKGPEIKGRDDKKTGSEKSAKKGKEGKEKGSQVKIKNEAAFISHGRPAMLAVVGSYALLKDNMIDAGGRSPNSMFVLNLIDALNHRTDLAVMRSKVQRFNPLRENIDPSVKEVVKVINIAGLPVLVILVGLVVWWRRRVRKKRIQAMFMDGSGK